MGSSAAVASVQLFVCTSGPSQNADLSADVCHLQHCRCLRLSMSVSLLFTTVDVCIAAVVYDCRCMHHCCCLLRLSMSAMSATLPTIATGPQHCLYPPLSLYHHCLYTTTAFMIPPLPLYTTTASIYDHCLYIRPLPLYTATVSISTTASIYHHCLYIHHCLSTTTASIPPLPLYHHCLYIPPLSL
jgi:hypothetical protein